MRRAAVLAVFLLLVSAWGCARATQPRGGPVPETPMQVVETSPEAFAELEPFDDPVRFTFDRRPSERPTDGQLRDAVVVSPRTGEVSVRHRRQGIEVRMEGGFTEEAVYRITLRPTLQDLWRNRLDEGFELFFSTGPEFEPNVLAGIVTDRLTGREVRDIRVDAEPVDGGLIHSTVTDSIGLFTFPFLPANGYRVRAYDDLNRNREPDFMERQDSTEVQVARGDTVIVMDLALLTPDTTAAILSEVEVVDSVTLRLEFDDHLDPERPLDGVRVTLARDPEGPAPAVRQVLYLHQWQALREEEAEREAEAAREAPEPDDPDAGDPDAGPPPEDPETPPPGVPGDPATPAAAPDADPDDPLPSTQIFVRLDAPLLPETAYVVTVEEVTNINGVPGGGGELSFETPPEPEEEPEPEDPDEPDDPDDPDDPVDPTDPGNATDPVDPTDPGSDPVDP